MENQPQIAYYRVSTKMQGKDGLGIEAQKAAVEKFLERKPDYEYIEVESGTNCFRRILISALEKVKEVNGRLVIAKLDRLGRNVHFISGLMNARVDFICCDNAHATPLMLNFLSAFAEEEARVISQRVSSAHRVLKEKIKNYGGYYTKKSGVFKNAICVPENSNPGYRGMLLVRNGLITIDEAKKIRIESKRYKIDNDPDLEKTRNLIFSLKDSGDSVIKIKNILNKSGIKTRFGNMFCTKQVYEILKNRKVDVVEIAEEVVEDLKEEEVIIGEVAL